MLSEGRVAVQARVRAPPSDGEANAALTVLLATALRVPKSAATIVGGATQRLKHVAIDGEATELAARLQAATGADLTD